MSEQTGEQDSAESQTPGIDDQDLPEDLQPGEDNPLAEPLDPDAEETKDAEELGMHDTQDDTTGTYRTEGELGDADTTSADAEETDSQDE